MSSLLFELVYALYFVFPAYVANALPVLLGGGHAIDGGKVWSDGRPVFGSHKTIRGFLAGVIGGTLVSVAEMAVLQAVKVPSDFILPFQPTILLGFVVSIGALIGDLVHSFVKRRLGIGEGLPFPVADQLDFVLGAILFSLPLIASSSPWLMILIILIITLPIHLLTNLLAYLLGLKKRPW